jgi:hypothetical protein
MGKEQAKLNLIKLVERFKTEFESGKTNAYTEEDTKKSFIEPLLSDVLGWSAMRGRDIIWYRLATFKNGKAVPIKGTATST